MKTSNIILLGLGTGLLVLLIFAREKAIDVPLRYILSFQNEEKIKKLQLKYQDKFRELIKKINDKGYNVNIVSGYRTFEEQKRLYEIDDRNARPGYSPHNYGIAVDINLQKGIKIWKKATTKEEWEATGVPKLARSLGFTWGGDFKTYHDPVHFDYRAEYKTSQLLAMAQQQGVAGNKVKLA